jgi:ketosteroid isomerase-like protein
MTHVTPAGASAEYVLRRFNAARNRHDLAAAIALTSTNCVFESSGPAPGGARSVGHAELEAAWKPLFDEPSGQYTVEESFTAAESFTAGTRVVQRWTRDWDGGQSRGVDISTVRDGLITEILAYRKG